MFTGAAMAQCPVNIGFDNGDFTNWEGETGNITTSGITMSSSGIVPGIHTLITRAQQQIDPYAGFSLSSPNGSSTVAMVGNNATGKGDNKAQRLSYTFTVPANNNNFSLIYYYAVVLEDPPNDITHTDATKPKFSAAVFNVTDNKYTDCANFNFVSISALPGFTKAPNQSPSGTVYYKSWSPVTIDLRGYAGKTIRLEFTTNNCVPGGHFAYAYIDVNQNCSSPLSGNIICESSNTLTLKAPEGFAGYHWYNGTDFTKQIGSASTYSITPIPPVGTPYSVIIDPFPGLGCTDTLTTTIQPVESLALNVVSTLTACRNTAVDITAANVTAGSDASFVYTYFTDAACTNYIIDPTSITVAGDYYIKATPPSDCFFVKKVTVSALPTPTLKITNPPEVCMPATVDITAANLRAGSTDAPNITYWTDSQATVSLNNPTKITKSGTYYIKASNSVGCTDIAPITVLIDNLPQLTINDVTGCKTADITTPLTTGNSQETDVTYTYWTNADCTVALLTPKAIITDGTYYIKATTTAGCSVSGPVIVKIFDYPQTTVTDPPSVIFPATIDISQSFTRQPGTAYYFYIDSLATHLVPDPTRISIRGTYYIRAVNGNNCALMFPVHANIDAPAVVDYGVNTFTPNGDGKNETFRLKITSSVKMSHFRVYSSWGALLFETSDYLQGWDGTNNGKKMPVGTYYWILDGYDNYTKTNIQKTGSVTIVL